MIDQEKIILPQLISILQKQDTSHAASWNCIFVIRINTLNTHIRNTTTYVYGGRYHHHISERERVLELDIILAYSVFLWVSPVVIVISYKGHAAKTRRCFSAVGVNPRGL